MSGSTAAAKDQAAAPSGDLEALCMTWVAGARQAARMLAAATGRQRSAALVTYADGLKVPIFVIGSVKRP